jgi:RES domain-containing protein
VLETYVHLPFLLRDDLPEMEAVGISVPNRSGMATVSMGQFKALMAGPDPLGACQAIGEDWLSRGDDLVLQVPSVVVPQENNVILNTQHRQMREVLIVSKEPFRFDPRLVRPR